MAKTEKTDAKPNRRNPSAAQILQAELELANNDIAQLKTEKEYLLQRVSQLEGISDANQKSAVEWRDIAKKRENTIEDLRAKNTALAHENLQMRGYIARIYEDERVAWLRENPQAPQRIPPEREFLANIEPRKKQPWEE